MRVEEVSWRLWGSVRKVCGDALEVVWGRRKQDVLAVCAFESVLVPGDSGCKLRCCQEKSFLY